jgi:hypothetical protein
VAAVIVVVVFAGSLTAYALGYDLWGAIATWTKETFGFNIVATEQQQLPEQLKEIELIMSEHGLPNTLLPSYIPYGYETIDVQCNKMTDATDISCLLESGDNSIILLYRVYSSGTFSSQFEKDEYNPAMYEANGITHYIMKNINTYFVAWTAGNIECNISGVTSYDEIIKIIDSINGG